MKKRHRGFFKLGDKRMPSRKYKIINTITTILTIIFIITAILLKTLYYQKRCSAGYFHSTLQTVVWITGSMFLTIFPMVLLLISCVADKSHVTTRGTTSLAASAVTTMLGIIVSLISMIISVFLNDTLWTDAAVKMLAYNVLTLIPIILKTINDNTQ
jgi:hypothetical protein